MNKLLPGSQIHIIDDDDAVRQALGLLIRSHGGCVWLHGSAEDFLAENTPLHKPSTATCLLLDLQLPGQNGAELLEKLQSEGRMLPVIVITGHTGTALMQRAVQAGAFAVVKKPFHNGELLSVINDVFDGSEKRA